MAETKLSNEDERRLTRVEDALEAHIQTCERNSNEAKWWLRALGLGLIGFVAKLLWTWATTGHLPH